MMMEPRLAQTLFPGLICPCIVFFCLHCFCGLVAANILLQLLQQGVVAVHLASYVANQ
jgi:hypothetical protein